MPTAVYTPRLATVEDLIEVLKVERAAEKTALLEAYLAAAEDQVEGWARRRFSPETPDDGTIVKTFTTNGRSSVRVPDLRQVTSIVVDGATLAPGYDYDLGYLSGSDPAVYLELYSGVQNDPARRFGQVSRIGGNRFADNLVVTGRWGFAQTPPAVRLAVLTQAAILWKRRDGGFQTTVVDENSGLITQPNSGISGDVAALIGRYRPQRVGIL